MMDLKKYSLEELLLVGIKSEVEAYKVYRSFAERVKNPFLRSRIETLAREEEKHREMLENLYRKLFPGKEIKLPENPETMPEFPELKIYYELGTTKDVRLILEQAMKAEKSAQQYYENIAEMVDDEYIKNVMRYMAKIEEEHYMILKREYDDMIEFESVMTDMDYVEFEGKF